MLGLYGIIKNIPVNTIITECLDGTLEHILSKVSGNNLILINKYLDFLTS